MNRQETPRQAGFSLIELMVAMVVTLIVSGAIYGLLATGKSAFRREPELSDRQQNIRIALTMIEQDIANAGLGMGSFTQIFTRGLDGGGVGVPDQLEIVTSDGSCPESIVCAFANPGTIVGADVDVALPLSNCFGAPVGATRLAGAVYQDAGTGLFDLTVIGRTTNAGNPGGVCGGNLEGVRLSLETDSGPATWRPGGVVPAGTPALVVPVDVVRYQVFEDAMGVPCLWRSTTGGLDPGTNYTGAPTVPPSPEWQLVARGLEDIQVQYTSVDAVGGLVVGDEPPVAADDDYTTVVFRVQVTLQALAMAPGLAGQTTSPIGPDAVRGQIVSSVSPRTALLALQHAPGATKWK